MSEKFKAILKVLKQDDDLNYDVQLDILRSGENQNGWDYQNIDKFAETFLGTPILCAYVGKQIGDGHNMREHHNPDGSVEYDFTDGTAERIVGTISETPEDLWTEVRDDQTWVVAKGKLWRFYNSKLVDHIAEAGSMEVSAETEVSESHVDENGVDVFTEWRGLGVTILNEKVAPAIPGANIKALQAMQSEFKELKLRAASLHRQSDSDTEENDNGEPSAENNNTAKADDSTIVNNAEESSETQKPQILNKGDKSKLKALTKKQIAALAVKFPGYTVLSAGQDDNGIHVCLLSASGETAVYNMASADEEIVAENILTVNAEVAFKTDEWELAVSAADLTDDLSAKVISANAAKDEAQAALEKANATIQAMTEAENKRRINACKAKAAETLEKFNANREAKVDNKFLNELSEKIDKGEFAACTAENGEWNGEAEITNMVLAHCAKAVMEQDKTAALARNNQFVWDGINTRKAAQDTAGDIGDLLNQFGIN